MYRVSGFSCFLFCVLIFVYFDCCHTEYSHDAAIVLVNITGAGEMSVMEHFCLKPCDELLLENIHKHIYIYIYIYMYIPNGKSHERYTDAMPWY